MHGLLLTDRVPPGGQVKIFRKKWNPALCSDGSNPNTKSDVVVGPMGKIFVTHGQFTVRKKSDLGPILGGCLIWSAPCSQRRTAKCSSIVFALDIIVLFVQAPETTFNIDMCNIVEISPAKCFCFDCNRI